MEMLYWWRSTYYDNPMRHAVYYDKALQPATATSVCGVGPTNLWYNPIEDPTKPDARCFKCLVKVTCKQEHV